MAAMELFCHLLGINPDRLTHQENLILEVDLFMRTCEELKALHKAKNKEYLCLMNVSVEKEKAMLEAKFLRNVA